jgi:hypothetical protein
MAAAEEAAEEAAAVAATEVAEENATQDVAWTEEEAPAAEWEDTEEKE